MDEVRISLGRGPVAALIGPRQCGKTTLARRRVKAAGAAYFDLEAYFCAIHSGSGLDVFFPGLRKGIEIKFVDAPRLSRSMRIAMDDLKLEELLVVYPGTREYGLADSIRVIPLKAACGNVPG